MLARVFDTAFAIPGTNFRFGIEAVMRLVPGIGDAAASALSCYLLYEAHRLDVPKPVFARLVANVDMLSGGRFIYGIGVGNAADEFAVLGAPHARRGAATNEALRIMLALSLLIGLLRRGRDELLQLASVTRFRQTRTAREERATVMPCRQSPQE